MAQVLKNVAGLFLNDSQSRFLWKGSLTQLSAPENITISSLTASFDEVENATSYEFFADGVSIGTYVVEAL